jgi:hypothetical protein
MTPSKLNFKPYNHQIELFKKQPWKHLIGFGCGCGKTRTILTLADMIGKTITVVAPKTQIEDRTWEREMEKIGLRLPMVTYSKEQFKKGVPGSKILILDESHVFCGVLPQTRYKNKIEIPKTSQLFDAVITWIQINRPEAIFLASATPFPAPLALYAVAKIFGEDWDYFSFRRKFYSYIPSIGRGIWVPKRDKQSEELLKMLALKFSTFGRLEDFFDVPDQVFKDIHVGTTPAQRREEKKLPILYPDPLSLIGKKHQLEQGIYEGTVLDENKTSEIIELAKEFKKLIVFARYTAQVNSIAEQLQKKFEKKDILILDGNTKDRGELLKRAEDPERETIVVAQSQVSTGYELPSFRCTVFASMSYSFVDYEQALGRTQRANAINKNVYVRLLAGSVDEAVLKCVSAKKDFNELLFTKEPV